MKHFVEGDKFLLDEKYFGSFVDPHHQCLGVVQYNVRTPEFLILSSSLVRARNNAKNSLAALDSCGRIISFLRHGKRTAAIWALTKPAATQLATFC